MKVLNSQSHEKVGHYSIFKAPTTIYSKRFEPIGV